MHAYSSDNCAYERNSEYSASSGTRVNVTQHLFQEIKYDDIELESDPPSMVSLNE